VLGKRNGIMVLVTDGQNTEPGQFISNVQAEVVESGIKVLAVGFGYVYARTPRLPDTFLVH
jgi:hypothetical protein